MILLSLAIEANAYTNRVTYTGSPGLKTGASSFSRSLCPAQPSSPSPLHHPDLDRAVGRKPGLHQPMTLEQNLPDGRSFLRDLLELILMKSCRDLQLPSMTDRLRLDTLREKTRKVSVEGAGLKNSGLPSCSRETRHGVEPKLSA